MRKKSNNQLIRLNKVLSKSGFGSRKEADKLIKIGAVKINDKIINKLGGKVRITDTIKVFNKEIRYDNNIYILLNKPKDFIIKNEENNDIKDIYSLLKGIKEKLFLVSKIENDASGLILLTNDKELRQKLEDNKYKIKEVYSVLLNREINDFDIQKIKRGIIIDNKLVSIKNIKKLKTGSDLGLEIVSGYSSKIKEVFRYLNYEIKNLDRTLYGPFTKKNLSRGKWKKLSKRDFMNLKSFYF
tara:strand:- start:3789 stop:4514 length:726 start_codon:yes stop_codon:yes gene_type:complete